MWKSWYCFAVYWYVRSIAMCLLSLSSHHFNIERRSFAAVCKCQVHVQVCHYSVKLTDHTQSLPHSHPSISTYKHIKQARVVPSMRHYFIICILMVLSIALQLILPWLEEIWDVSRTRWHSLLSFPRMQRIAWAGWIWSMGQRPTSWSWTHAPAKRGLWPWLE